MWAYIRQGGDHAIYFKLYVYIRVRYVLCRTRSFQLNILEMGEWNMGISKIGNSLKVVQVRGEWEITEDCGKRERGEFDYLGKADEGNENNNESGEQ